MTFQSLQQGPLRQAPQAHAAGVATTCQQAAVRGESQADHLTIICPPLQQAAFCQVPERQGAACIPAGQQVPIGAYGETPNGLATFFQGSEKMPVGKVPQPDRPIHTAAGDDFPLWANLQTADTAGMGWPHERLKRFSPRQSPEAHNSAIVAADQDLPTRADGQM